MTGSSGLVTEAWKPWKACRLSKTSWGLWLFFSYLEARQARRESVHSHWRAVCFVQTNRPYVWSGRFCRSLILFDCGSRLFASQAYDFIVQRLNNVREPFDRRSQPLAYRQGHFHGILIAADGRTSAQQACGYNFPRWPDLCDFQCALRRWRTLIP